MSSRRYLLGVLIVLAGGVSGCANGGKVREANRYVNAVNTAQGSFADTSERLLREISPGSAPRKDRALLRRFYTAVDEFVAQLRAITPPANVRTLHERLTAAMVRFGTSLRGAGADITSGVTSRVLDGQQKLSVATAGVSKAINTTIAAINAALMS